MVLQRYDPRFDRPAGRGGIMSRTNAKRMVAVVALALGVVATPREPARGAVTRAEVERAIKDGVRFLVRKQRDDGSWPDADNRASTGTTSLITLALLTAGEKPDSPAVSKALGYLQQFTAEELRRTYSVALQTMFFAA